MNYQRKISWTCLKITWWIGVALLVLHFCRVNVCCFEGVFPLWTIAVAVSYNREVLSTGAWYQNARAIPTEKFRRKESEKTP